MVVEFASHHTDDMTDIGNSSPREWWFTGIQLCTQEMREGKVSSNANSEKRKPCILRQAIHGVEASVVLLV
jgi:hypothetical protein